MTQKERVCAALRHEEGDAIPYMINIDPEVEERLDAYYGGRERWPQYENCLAGTGWEWQRERLEGNRFRDPFGVIWREGNIFQPIEPVLKGPNMEGCEWPEALVTDEDVEAVRRFCSENKAKFTIYTLGLLLFERSWALRGFENILADFVENPSFVEALYDRLTQLQLDALDKLLPLPLDSITFGDDFGQQNGLIMGPRYWRRYLKPRLAMLYGKVRDAGKVVRIHSCGDNSEIMGELIEIGVQIFNPFQPEAMDVFEMKRRYGKSICFEGGIGTQVTLPRGTPQQVREEVATCARVLGEGGGYIMTTTKPIRPEVPTENAVACLEAIIEESQRRG